MTTLYDKDGGEHKVLHSIDVKEWIKAGYSVEAPEPKIAVKKKPATKKKDD